MTAFTINTLFINVNSNTEIWINKSYRTYVINLYSYLEVHTYSYLGKRIERPHNSHYPQFNKTSTEEIEQVIEIDIYINNLANI